MSENTSYVERFYEGNQITLPALSCYAGRAVLHDSVELQLPEWLNDITEEEVEQTIRTMEWGILGHEGSRFRVGWLNHDRRDEEAVAFFSTFSSDLGPGNVFEFAYRAVAMQHRTKRQVPYMYVSTYGRDSSLALRPSEMEYAKRTGNLLRPNDKGEMVAIPTIQHLARALDNTGLHITRLRGTSAGSAVGLAVGCELGHITQTAFDHPMQITQTGEFERLVRMRGVEEKIKLPHNKQATNDPWVVTPEREQMVREALPDLYEPDQSPFTFLEKFQRLRANAIILGHGVNGHDPLGQTLAAFFARHPEAKTNLIVGTSDTLYTRKWRKNIQLLVDRFAHDNAGPFLRFVLLPGMTHSSGSYRPMLYEALISDLLELPDSPQ